MSKNFNPNRPRLLALAFLASAFALAQYSSNETASLPQKKPLRLTSQANPQGTSSAPDRHYGREPNHRPPKKSVFQRKETASKRPAWKTFRSSPRVANTVRWDYRQSGLNDHAIAPFMSAEHLRPQSIRFAGDNGIQVISPIAEDDQEIVPSRVLNLSTQGAVERLRQARSDRSFGTSQGGVPQSSDDETPPLGMKALPENAYSVVAFRPGLRDGMTESLEKPSAKKVIASIQGPDFDGGSTTSQKKWTTDAELSQSDQSLLANIRDRVLSFGHGGQLTLKIADGGVILDRPGPDFHIFENPFYYGQGWLYQEFAQVSVSVDGKNYKKFKCNPGSKIHFCAGAIPTQSGGDGFDLSEVGLDEVRYIRIKDLGNNQNYAGGGETEGFDLDAIRLDHAFRAL